MKRAADQEPAAPVEALPGRLPTAAAYEAFFEGLSRTVLLERELHAGDDVYHFLEVEAYCRDVDSAGSAWQDPFIHGAEMQLVPGAFYFHRQGSAYRGGTYKGLDLSFGCAQVYGGRRTR